MKMKEFGPRGGFPGAPSWIRQCKPASAILQSMTSRYSLLQRKIGDSLRQNISNMGAQYRIQDFPERHWWI